MERQTISLEPYIEAGGILGKRLEINPRAADSVMKRTALRRNVEIRKGYGRKGISAVGTDELALRPTMKLGNVKEEDFSLTSSSFTSDTLMIQVHDQALAEEVDTWMQANYKKKKSEGKGNFDAIYAARLSEEISSRLKKSFYDEKKEILSESWDNLAPRLFNTLGVIAYFFGAVSVVSDVTFFGLDREIPGPKNILTNEIFDFGLGYLSFKFSDFLEHLHEEERKPNLVSINGFEDKFVNLQIPSLVLGTASLAINSGKLIRLNDSK